MACNSPLYRVPVGSLNFARLAAVDQSRARNGGVFLKASDLLSYQDVPGWNSDAVQVIRCGQCTDCRLNYSRDWAIRCSLEASMHEFNYFVTLTYDDFNLPKGEFVDYAGNIWDSNLLRRDVQLFLKNLREWERIHNNNIGIKVFYCGEYGSADYTARPHYHLCLFGVSEIPDLIFKFRKGQFSHYSSELYNRFWSSKVDGLSVFKGFVDITECSFDSMAYTARYCMKKQRGVMKKDFLEYYETLDSDSRPKLRTQPFVGMSLKPGIASEYFVEHKDQIYSEDLVKYQKKFKLYCAKPPRYFDKLFDVSDPELSSELKDNRARSGIAARKLKAKLFSEPLADRQRREEQMLKDKEEKFHVRSL